MIKCVDDLITVRTENEIRTYNKTYEKGAVSSHGIRKNHQKEKTKKIETGRAE